MNQMSINNNFAMNDIIDIFIKTCKIENYWAKLISFR